MPRSLGALSSLALALLAGSTALTVGAPRASGQSVPPALAQALNGEWALATRETDARSLIERAIDRAIDGMLPFVRGAAQGELRARTPVDARIGIELEPERFVVRLGGNAFRTEPGRPQRIAVPGFAGETVEVVQLVRGGRLEQVFSTEQGRRWNVLTPSADGSRLMLDVTMSGTLLPAAVQYRLEYRRMP